jgi:phosphoserine phosphatase
MSGAQTFLKLSSWCWLRRREVKRFVFCFVAACVSAGSAQPTSAQADPLPSWNDGTNKQAIIKFVTKVTEEGGPDFVSPTQRIATFDNDGTLWCEQPLYFQALFIFDRVKALASQHPEWKTKQPFKAVLDGDFKTVAAGGEHALVELGLATHADMTTDEFAAIVKNWLATARHPRFQRPYTELVYQPMLEVLAYLRANGFKTFVVSGGGIEFMRVFAEETYGIPPEQVIGSSIETKYEVRDGRPVLMRLPEPKFINDKAAKVVAINQHIGRRPTIAFGNSDGDFEMLEWTTSGSGPRLGVYIHHDDATREYAYDRKSSVGRLSRGLDEAPKRGWLVVSMRDDWKRMFAFDKP